MAGGRVASGQGADYSGAFSQTQRPKSAISRFFWRRRPGLASGLETAAPTGYSNRPDRYPPR